MPIIASISVLRHGTFSHLLRRFSVSVLAKREVPDDVSRKPQPSNNLLKAKRNFKEYSSLSPVLSPDDQAAVSASQSVGMVVAAQANFMRVVVSSDHEASGRFEEGPEAYRDGVELLCVVRALLKKIKRRVMVGDRVLVGSIDWVELRGVIENVFQRSSEILDPPVANVDHLLVLFSLDQPNPEPFTLTRFLIEAESSGIPLTLAMNKSELVDDETLTEWKNRLGEWGYEPVFCSVETRHGLDHLASTLKNQTSVIVGPSGVGKSSLINALRQDHLAQGAVEEENLLHPDSGSKWFEEQRIGEVSARSGRGKHTTRNVSLLPLTSGGYVADTPGFNEPSLMKVTKQSLPQMFPEIRKMISDSETGKCAFSDCMHIGEPGCVVEADWERYQYYIQLVDVIEVREKFQLRTYGTKKESDVRYKVGPKGVKQAEPRLVPKKHRRESRKKTNQSILDDLDDDDEEVIDYVR